MIRSDHPARFFKRLSKSSEMAEPEILHPALRAIHTYWTGLQSDGGLPRRSSLSPADIPREALPRVFLIEFLDDEAAYRLRLQGTYMVDAYQQDFTGRKMIDEEIPGISKSVTLKLLERLRADRAPQHFHGPTAFRVTDFYTEHEQILLPLTDRTGRICMALGAIDFTGVDSDRIFLRH